jgi:hypothetical protein
VSSTACTRCFKLERWRTSCKRQRARSRSARTRGSGSQIPGTRSRRASSASTQASIRSVVHARGAKALHLLRLGDLDLPTHELEPIAHQARPIHRLDRGADRRTQTLKALAQPSQTVNIRRRGADVNRCTVVVEQVEVQTLATEIQTGVQHRSGPPLRQLPVTNRSVSPGRPLFMAFLTIEQRGG